MNFLDFSNMAWQPLSSLAFDPDPDATLACSVGKFTLTMLFSDCPIAFVLFAVRPNVDTESVLHIFVVLSLIFPSIRPRVHATDIELILLPSPIIPSPIRPIIDSLAVNEIVRPLSTVRITIIPLVNSLAVLHTDVERTFVHASILETLSSVSFFEVVNPTSRICHATRVLVSAMPICLVSLEVSLK